MVHLFRIVNIKKYQKHQLQFHSNKQASMHDRKYDNSVENVENYHWLMKNSNETLCSSSEKPIK